MKTNLGDAKSQMDQNLYGIVLVLNSIFTSDQNFPMSHPRMNCS